MADKAEETVKVDASPNDGAGQAANGEDTGQTAAEVQETAPAKTKKSKRNKSDKSERIRDVVELRRTAKEVKKHMIVTRVMALLVGILVAIVAVAYAIAYFYDKFGSFTVKVNKYDMARQGLCLSETPEYDHTISELNADIVYDMTNISGNDLPANIDMVNGSHNGENYIAYTFYLINSGEDTLSYEGELVIDNVTKGVDEAVRIAVYKNGERTLYGKTKSNGTGMESDCDKEFLSATTVMRTRAEGFKPKDRDKYTIVIWLEGNDPDCVDKIIGGTIKFTMLFKIIETT
ncbi:hypothetical protein SAMN04487934_103163 [Eubacterium ruminantium]|nr:hypothetical protein SAMN04487934_103163 [Eubacterium ruminantium]